MTNPKLTLTIEQVEDLFLLLNRKFYHGELEKPIISVLSKEEKREHWCIGRKVWVVVGDKKYYEIDIYGTHIGKIGLSEVLLHEMAHLYNHQHDICDTSQGERYHNKRFYETAVQHGLYVEKSKRYGYNITSLTEEAREYVSCIRDIEFEIHSALYPQQQVFIR